MEAIILAGGLGTRLREVVPDWPKPMAPVAGRPFLEIVLRALASKGFSHIVLSLGFMAEKILHHFGREFAGMSLDYVVEETPLGTGGGLRLAMTLCRQDHLFVLNGDTYLDLEATLIDDYWNARRNPIIIARHVPDTARYGRLLVENGMVNAFSEKENGETGPGLINAGCYVFSSNLLNEFQLYKPFSLERDFLATAVHKMPIDVIVSNGYFIDIGIPEDYKRAQTELVKG